MFEVTSHGMNFTTILPNQAHTCNTLPFHAILCCCNAITCYCMQYLVIAIRNIVFKRFFEKGVRRNSCNNCLLHFGVEMRACNGDGFAA